MELRQLRYYVVIAEELSFSRAAVRLRVSQPPLSRQIANLETELGTRLLNRNKHGVSLTESGRVFYTEALKSLAAVERTVRLTQRAAKGLTGSLSLGFGGSAAYTFAPSLLRRFRIKYPEVELSLHSIPITGQLKSLREQTIDIGFLILPVNDDDISTKLLLRDPLVVAVPTAHPLAQSSVAPLRAIEPYQLITFPRSIEFGFFAHIVSMCKRAGFVPTVAQEVAPMESVIGLVAAGVGVAVVPSVARRLRISGVEYLPIRERYAFVEFAMAWRKDKTSPVVSAFLNLARERAAPQKTQA